MKKIIVDSAKNLTQQGAILICVGFFALTSVLMADSYADSPAKAAAPKTDSSSYSSGTDSTTTEDLPGSASVSETDALPETVTIPASELEPFYGPHQGGILTSMQTYTCFAVFDVTAKDRKQLIALLKSWTKAAALMTSGKPGQDLGADPRQAPGDSGDVLDISPDRLTVTFGFGPGLFSKDGKDRYGLANRRPEALIDLPKFPGDQLVESHTGGDISIQACSDDAEVALHAVRQFTRLADGLAALRWEQNGFVPKTPKGQTPRNLMGFKDGTMNPKTDDPKAMDQFVWVGKEGPQWMRGGSYMVVRPIRIALEHWDRMKKAFQEQTVGRKKYSGAPLTGNVENDKLDLAANDKDGNSVIPENSHARLGAPEENNGAQMLRRAYSYDNNLAFTAERWPPWRQGMEMDAGLLFQCYQKDPRTAFVQMFTKMSRFDMMNQFLTHVGSGIFACPPGAKPGKYVGQELFE